MRAPKAAAATGGAPCSPLRQVDPDPARDRRRRELPPLPVRQLVDGCRRPHGLRFRPERRRLCRLHRRRRGRRPGHRRARRSARPDGQFDNAQACARPRRGIEYVLKGGGAESYRPTFTFFGLPLRARHHRGQGRDHRDRVGPDQLGASTPTGDVHLGASAGQPAGREHASGRSAPTSSTCRPTARSATSASAGPATRRSSPRPPAICTTARASCANGCAT